MTAFLCLHGAWHGAWVWDRVVTALREQGHQVHAPDLPGLGRHAGHIDAVDTKAIDLQCHVEAVVPTEPVILVAHSYAGMLARVIADRVPNLIEHLILIEALWPEDGQSALDLLSPAVRCTTETAIRDLGHGVAIPPPPASQFHLDNVALEKEIDMKLTPQPAATFRQSVELCSDEAEPIGCYVIATDRDPQPYKTIASRLQKRGWQLIQSTGGHALMLTRPEFITRLLHETAMRGHYET